MKRAQKKAPILLLSLLLPMGVTAVVFAIAGITPFGGRSLGVQDMSNQYLAILSSLRDMLTGRASPLYLPSMALGGNMMGVDAYYLMSPLDLLTCLVPREGLLTAASLLYILRVGLCGLTMAVYCGQRRGYGPRLLLPALAYGMMSFMTAYCINYLWQDCAALLPLVALGVVRVREGRSRWLYILCLAGALAINFYIGYMLCIFSVLLFFFELLTGPRAGRGRAVVRFGLSSLAAGALAAVVLVPAFLSLAGGKAGFSLSQLTFTAKFDLPQLLVKLYPGAFDFDEINPSGLPNIFTGTVTTALAVLYLANGAVPRRRRAGGAALAGVIVLSFWVSALDLVWHGMNVPSWYNYRYSFLFSFLVASAADCEAASFREGTRPRHLLLPPAAAALCGLLAFAGRSYDFIRWPAALVAVGAAALVSLGLYAVLRPGAGPRLTAALAAGVLALHGADMGYNGLVTLSRVTYASSDPVQWAEYVREKSAAVDLVDTGGAFVRVESLDQIDMDRCEPMLFGYDGLSHYTSNLAEKNLDFLERLGLVRYTDLYALYSRGVTAGADALLGVRYLVASDLEKPYEAVASAGTFTVYENADALPIGWTADDALADRLGEKDCFAYLQAIYAAAAPEVDRDVYVPAAVDSVATEGFREEDGGRFVLDGASSGSVTYTLTPQLDGPLYAQLSIPGFPGAMVYVNGQYLTHYADAQSNGSLYLGDFAAGQTVTLEVRAFADITVSGAAFATEDGQALAAYSEALQAGGCPLRRLSGHHFAGQFTTGQGDGLLVLTIPWDSAWRIWLDGERVEALQIQHCLTAIPVTPGTHTLEMRYLPAGLVPGGAVSAAALIVCLAVWLGERRKRRSE